MSISSRITNMETNISNAYTSINNLGVDLSNVDKNLENLSTKINAIYQAYPKVTATGETISLNDTKYARMDTVVKGNSEQVQTTQSANLFDEEYYKNATYSTDVYKYTVAKFKGDRELYVKAQLKSGGSEISGLYVGISATPNPNDSGGIYRMAISNGYVPAYSIRDFSGYSTLYFCYFPTNISLSDVFNNYDFWVSTDDINYTPFVPNSPSPDYPSSIQNVTGDVEVLVQNKNKLSACADFTETVSNVTFKAENGVYTINGIASARIDLDKTIEEYTIKSGDYFHLGNEALNTVMTFSLKCTDNTIISGYGSTVNRIYDLSSYVGKTINKISFGIGNGSTLSNSVFKPMIVKSSTATTYVSHQEQTFLFPLGTQRLMLGDYLADDGIHHVRKQVVLDGTENWLFESSLTTPTNRTVIRTSDKTDFKNTNYLSNYFIVNSSSSNRVVLNIVGGKMIYLSLEDTISGIETTDSDSVKLNKIKTWLSNNNVTVEYELATEEITPYTTAQQTAYNQIKQAFSYDEQTNVSGTSDEITPIFQITALKGE